MNGLDLILDAGDRESACKKYSHIVITNVVETFRHIIDKDVGFDRAKIYNAIVALICIMWINENPPNKYKTLLPKAKGYFILDVALIKGIWFKDKDTFIDHEWVDVGGEPLVIAMPLGHKEREKRTMLDIGPYLEQRIDKDKQLYKPTTVLDIEECNSRIKNKITLLDGRETTIEMYAKDLFRSKFPKS